MTRVFVYGTLKRGQPNHHRLFDSSNGKSEFLGSARTVESFPLVIAGVHNIPYLLAVPGRGNRVHGEVYEVDGRMLRFLDEFEGVPVHYQRTEVKLEVKEWAARADGGTPPPGPGTVTEAFVYNTNTYRPEWTELPTYENYDSYGEHGLKYVEREARDG